MYSGAMSCEQVMFAISAEAHADEADEGNALALLKSWTARVDGIRQHHSDVARRNDMADTIIVAMSLDPELRMMRARCRAYRASTQDVQGHQVPCGSFSLVRTCLPDPVRAVSGAVIGGGIWRSVLPSGLLDINRE
jgi:hypothetical protein